MSSYNIDDFSTTPTSSSLKDITELFSVFDGSPVCVRLFDPPLHEFLPKTDAELSYVARAAGVPLERVKRRAAELREARSERNHFLKRFKSLYKLKIIKTYH